MAGEKTEKATPKRKRDEREKGNTFQSREVVTVISLLAMFYSIKLLGPIYISTLEKGITYFFEMGASVTYIGLAEVGQYLIYGCYMLALTALPLLLISGLVAIIATMGQTRMLVSFKALKFKASRINPLEGLKKMFSLRSLVELLKSVLKIIVLIAIIYSQLKNKLIIIPKLMDMQPMQAALNCVDFIFAIVNSVAAIFAFIAAGDYLYQWFDYEKNLRMSKQEIKEEYKNTEGDPQIKGKIKDKQRRMAQSRMMQAVPSADVVIRNPTHFAVAIQYNKEKHRAPVVIAKGKDLIALKIVEIAEKNNVIVTENIPLARSLYAEVELEREIPGHFYKAVAEVLAFVYKLKNKKI